MPRTIAALYIDSARGPYPRLPDVECWDEERDATRYAGPHPVVAHPMCGHWGRYAWKAHDTGATGIRAVEQVREWGGVLEQPKDSKLFAHCGLPRPGEPADSYGGYSILVYQRDWGHRADKATWLYLVRCAPAPMPAPVAHRPTNTVLRTGHVTRGQIELMAKSQRHLTPIAFARWLVATARSTTT
jgi:hypothetical protein